MKLIEITEPFKPIVLVMGKLCSGKNQFCQSYKRQGYHHITTSDIVKKVSGMQNRSDLQQTHDYDQLIADEMIKVIQQYPKIVIDGIRQVSILRRLEAEFNDSIGMVWLDVPEEIRQDRFIDRGAFKDNQSFDDAQQGDHNLGLTDVENYVKSKSKIVNHY